MDEQFDLVDPPASLKSPAWKHFGFKRVNGVVDKANTICRLCSCSVSYKSGTTTNMITHLKRKHNIETDRPSSDSCIKVKPVGQLRLTDVFDRKTKYTRSSDRHLAITKSIAVFIAKDMRPYSVVQNEGFKRMVGVLDPRYEIPSRTHFAEKVIPDLYRETKQIVSAKLNSAPFVALTSDSWTSRATQSFNTITAHIIDDNWEINNFVLETTLMSESHTAENISNFLTNSISKWDLKKNGQLPSITTDNAANVVNAAKLAELSHVGCFAHSINLASQRGLHVPQMDRLLGRMRRVVSFFHRSTTAASVLRDKQALLSLPSHKLINDVPTRWNSSYDMIERYLEQQPAIEAALLTKDIKKNAKDIHLLSEDDVSSAEDAMKVFGPLKIITTIMSDSKSPTLSMIHPLKEQMLKDLQITESDSPLIRDVKSAVGKDLKSRYIKPDVLLLLHASSCLDPRFKSMPYLSTEERNDVYNALTMKAMQLNNQPVKVKTEKPEVTTAETPTLPEEPIIDNASVTTNVSNINVKIEEPPQKRQKSALDNLFSDVFVTKVETGMSLENRVDTEILAYKTESSVPLNANPLVWWQTHEYKYPLLSKLAKLYHTIPATSVASERVFSTAGDVVTSQRCCLHPDQVDYLIFLKKNLVI